MSWMGYNSRNVLFPSWTREARDERASRLAPPEGPGAGCVPGLWPRLWWPRAFLGLWVALSLCLFMSSRSACLPPCPGFSFGQSHGIRAQPDDLVLPWSSAKTLCPDKLTFTGTRGWVFTSLGGDTIQFITLSYIFSPGLLHGARSGRRPAISHCIATAPPARPRLR